jgi:hypothetical protein
MVGQRREREVAGVTGRRVQGVDHLFGAVILRDVEALILDFKTLI